MNVTTDNTVTVKYKIENIDSIDKWHVRYCHLSSTVRFTSLKIQIHTEQHMNKEKPDVRIRYIKNKANRHSVISSFTSEKQKQKQKKQNEKELFEKDNCSFVLKIQTYARVIGTKLFFPPFFFLLSFLKISNRHKSLCILKRQRDHR